MATLASLRAKLNTEIGVVTDSETSPWTTAQRNAAISEGYAELWRAGVYKDAKQDFATLNDTWQYALTSIRKLHRLELLDSSSRILECPKGVIEPDGTGAGTFQVRLRSPISAGFTLRVRGWAPYTSVFANDAAVDNLPAEYNRLPLLKARAILYRQQLAKFARWGENQVVPPPMSVSIDALLGLIATAEREFDEMARDLRAQRTRTSIPGRL
jgi:hypothetical protein